MAKDHGPSVKDDKQYEGLRKKGMSKERAARIADDPNSSSKGGKASGSGTRRDTKEPGRHQGPEGGRRAQRRQGRGQEELTSCRAQSSSLPLWRSGSSRPSATGTIFLLVPFVVIALGALSSCPLIFGAMRGTRLEAGASDSHGGGGVPSTSEASYEPVQQPRRP